MNKLLIFIAIATMITGCMSIEGMNADLERIDQAWEIDNKRAIAQRRHIVNTDYDTTFKAVEKTLTDLKMTIVKSSIEKGFVTSKNEAPTPLTIEQWRVVRKAENPRISDVAGWMYSLAEIPSGQYVNTKVSIESAGSQSTVNLDYYINIPEYDDMGLVTPKNVAPMAEKLACEVFWDQLDKNIAKAK